MMDKEDHLQQHLELCKRVYLRLKAEGKWPWPDSPISDDMIESGDNTNIA
jgi:hypothetical protein